MDRKPCNRARNGLSWVSGPSFRYQVTIIRHSITRPPCHNHKTCRYQDSRTLSLNMPISGSTQPAKKAAMLGFLIILGSYNGPNIMEL